MEKVRDFKFRIWNVVYKEFIYSPSKQFLIGLDGFLFDGDGCIYDEEHVINQFTGYYSKDKREIYENDIISFVYLAPDYDENDEAAKQSRKLDQTVFISKVEWDKVAAGFVLKSGPIVFSLVHCSRAEVVGNIYENPEVLNQEKL